MKLPVNINQAEFMEALDKIMVRIRKKYHYSVHDGDDLAQEAYFIAIEICKSYKSEMGPLYNFLSVSVGNRVKNFIRNKANKEVSTISIFDTEEDSMKKIGNMKTTNIEFWDIIDDNLHASFRSDYLKIRQGIDIPKLKKAKLIIELKRIVDEYL